MILVLHCNIDIGVIYVFRQKPPQLRYLFSSDKHEFVRMISIVAVLCKEPFTNDVIVLKGEGSPNYDGK